MRCGALVADDCAIGHWCRTVASAHREPTEWRGDCPYPGCGADRALWWKTWGRGISWGSYCAHHPKETLRPVLDKLLPGCITSRPGPAMIAPADAGALARSGLHETALKVVLLEMSGLTIDAALDELGTERSTRYRIKRQVLHWRHKTADR